MPCSALIEYLLLLENVSQYNEMAQRSYKCYELVKKLQNNENKKSKPKNELHPVFAPNRERARNQDIILFLIPSNANFSLTTGKYQPYS